ncbi:hypothetical protein EVA_05020 [gut metagenome]|uniref:Uncharacterized protein n=1 Tax=gut metagenome TaxID=749906 RepID=J9GHC2_9ZZZZ
MHLGPFPSGVAWQTEVHWSEWSCYPRQCHHRNAVAKS